MVGPQALKPHAFLSPFPSAFLIAEWKEQTQVTRRTVFCSKKPGLCLWSLLSEEMQCDAIAATQRPDLHIHLNCCTSGSSGEMSPIKQEHQGTGVTSVPKGSRWAGDGCKLMLRHCFCTSPSFSCHLEYLDILCGTLRIRLCLCLFLCILCLSLLLLLCVAAL